MLKLSKNLFKLSANSKAARKHYYSTNLEKYVAVNEPIYDYKRDSSERAELHKTLVNFLTIKGGDQREPLFDVPIVIGDKEIRTKNVKYQLVPFEHNIKLARFYHADKNLINEAIQNSLDTRAAWESTSFSYRSNILLKAADMLAKSKRADILAATMLGQGKTVFQAGN
jgi:1-pyrroline-5-carboxylate dehydrogenase